MRKSCFGLCLLLVHVGVTADIRGQTAGVTVESIENDLRNYKYNAGLTDARQLLESLTSQTDVTGEARSTRIRVLLLIASFHRAKGAYADALDAYERVLKSAGTHNGVNRSEHNERPVAEALHGLGTLYQMQGDHRTALHMYNRALAMRVRALGSWHLDVADTLNGLGSLHQQMANRDKALELGNRDKSLAFYRKALAIRRRIHGNSHVQIAESLSNLGSLYQDRTEMDRAKKAYQAAFSMLVHTHDEHHPAVATVTYNLAWHYQLTGQHERARKLHEMALKIRRKLYGPDHHEVGLSHRALAQLHLALDDYDRALQALQDSERVLSRHISLSIAAESERGRRLFMELFAGDVDAAVALAITTRRKTASQLAYTKVLRHKGRVLDSMARTFAIIHARAEPADRTLLDEYRDNRSQHAALLLHRPGTMEIATYNRMLDTLEDQRHALERRLGSRTRALVSRAKAAEIKEVQAALRPGEVLVEWVRYRPSPTATKQHFAVAILHESGAPRWVDLGAAHAIDDLVRRYHEALGNRDRDVEQLAYRLFEHIMAPVFARVAASCSAFWLVPDGSLNMVPFAALIDSKKQFLVHKYSFRYVTSGRDLLQFRRLTPFPARSPPLVVADPDYGAQNESAMQTFTPLSGTASEANAIRQFFPSATTLLGEHAREASIKQIQAPQILHIASHGFLGAGHCSPRDWRQYGAPRAYGVALAGANTCSDKQEDGLLTALEISALDLHGTRLAAMSACETALGQISVQSSDGTDRISTLADGVYGIRRSLVLAGAESQLLGLWRIDDNATLRLMKQYYGFLVQGVGRGDALRQAQLQLLANQPSLHPYYWAGLILSGNPAPLVGPEPPPSSVCTLRKSIADEEVAADPTQILSIQMNLGLLFAGNNMAPIFSGYVSGRHPKNLFSLLGYLQFCAMCGTAYRGLNLAVSAPVGRGRLGFLLGIGDFQSGDAKIWSSTFGVTGSLHHRPITLVGSLFGTRGVAGDDKVTSYTYVASLASRHITALYSRTFMTDYPDKDPMDKRHIHMILTIIDDKQGTVIFLSGLMIPLGQEYIYSGTTALGLGSRFVSTIGASVAKHPSGEAIAILTLGFGTGAAANPALLLSVISGNWWGGAYQLLY